MQVLQRFALTVLTLSALSFVAVGCATTGSTDGDTTFKKVTGEAHRAVHPDGHAPKEGRNCHYDREGDVFFCSFAK